MFDRFIFQNLNKLVESEVRYFSAPKSFHAINVERFKAQCIVFGTKLSSKLPVPIFALPCYFSVLPCYCALGTIPAIRFETLRLKFLFRVLNLFKDCFKNCGASILLPSEPVRNVFSPKSNPAPLPVLGIGSVSSTLSQLKHIQ